jgi:hypothetical protein
MYDRFLYGVNRSDKEVKRSFIITKLNPRQLMHPDFPSPRDVHGWVCKERIRQSETWFSCQVELWTAAVENRKRELSGAEDARYEAAKASIRQGIVSQYGSIPPDDRKAIGRYLGRWPSKVAMWKLLED